MHELWAADFRSWLSINPATVDVLTDLRAGGTPLALLSNAGPDYASYFRHGPLGDFFSACYVSGELGLLKPHADIYRHVLGDLGTHARPGDLRRQPRVQRGRGRGARRHRARVHGRGTSAGVPGIAGAGHVGEPSPGHGPRPAKQGPGQPFPG